MMRRLRKNIGSLRGLFKSMLRFKETTPEVYIISFPKCGRTWLRVMLGRVYQLRFNRQHVELFDDLSNVKKGFRIQFTHDDEPFWKKPNELKTTKEEYKEKKVIFLYRDPRDVLVSSYFEKNKRIKLYGDYSSRPDMKEYLDRITQYTGSIHDYVNYEIGGFETILRYFNIWSDNKHVPKKYLAISYEGMITNPQDCLRRILNFLDIGHDDNIVDDAVKFSAFENMKSIESNSGFNSPRLQPADKNDIESYKVRKGKVQGYTDYLTEEEIKSMNLKMRQILSAEYAYT